MNPYLHEFRYLLTRRAVIGAVAVAILAGIVLFSPVYEDAETISITGTGFAFEQHGNVTVEIWDYDSAGVAVPGVHVRLNVTECPSNPYCAPMVLLLVTTTVSDGSGFSALTFVAPTPTGGTNESLSVAISATYPPAAAPTMEGALSESFGLPLNATGNLTFLAGAINSVQENYYSEASRSLITWAGPLGASPAGDRVINCLTFGSVEGFNYTEPDNCTGAAWTNEVGVLTGPVTILPAPAVPPTDLSDQAYEVQYEEILNRTGAPVFIENLGGYYDYFGPEPEQGGPVEVSSPTANGPGLGLLQTFGTAMALFGPIMGLMLAYWGYARPRLSGTLESTLARPVTRPGLFLTRYLTIAITLAIISVAEGLILDAELAGALREPLPGGDLAALIGGLAVATIGVAGIVLLLAHVFRSPGPVLGIGIAVVIVFGLLWSILILLLELLVLGPQFDATTPMWAVWSNLIAPGQYVNNAVSLQTDVPPADVGSFGWAGINGIVLVVAGLAWIVLPFAGSYWLAQRRE